MKNLILVLALVSISGCTTIANKAADWNDDALKTSEFTICRAASVGAVLRRYNTKELSQAWVKLCIDSNNNTNPLVTEVANNDE